ncbi:MAG TPA: hypothetical protein VED45_08365 [Steroidobacteraceae bacterium]|nr:hypothetical protein [Steroidobacteraceae bacterium]
MRVPVVGTLLVGTLLLALSGAARGQAAAESCQTYTRSGAGAPEVVRDWLGRSGDERVTVCSAPAAPGAAGAEAPPRYRGESAVSRHASVCSYSSHGLVKVGSGAAARLQRYDRGDAVRMALAGEDCPPAHPAPAAPGYTETYDVSPAAFLAIVQLWQAAAASTTSFDQASCCGNDGANPGPVPSATSAATRARLRAAIGAGQMRTAAIIRIVRLSGTLLRRRYALLVADPEQHSGGTGLYVLYVSKPLTGPYRITSIVAAAG